MIKSAKKNKKSGPVSIEMQYRKSCNDRMTNSRNFKTQTEQVIKNNPLKKQTITVESDWFEYSETFQFYFRLKTDISDFPEFHVWTENSVNSRGL